ncbi:MAG: hypothetical protein UR94_C0009G0008 [Parcubacteria group bacterium GW2011_GWA2_36_10]|nr:MAG: hypothetical protein UR94_C0009G0008 [Parcubacteria group bacterium GW2011_GWA2_36_10]
MRGEVNLTELAKKSNILVKLNTTIQKRETEPWKAPRETAGLFIGSTS